MALGPPVSAAAFVVVYNPSQYINKIINGQAHERSEALKHLLECILHSDIDLITLASIWLCVTNLLNNEEQNGSINTDARICAWKCVLELIKLEQLQRRFFKLWLTFDFLARYKIVNETDAAFWLDCFYALTEDGKRIDLIDDRIRARLFVQFINGILTGPMSRNTQAYNVLRESLTLNCYLRYDEVSLILENIFRQLNQEDDDSASNAHHSLNQSAVRKSLEFLAWLIDYHVLDTGLLHYFIRNVVDLHDKYKFSTTINTELLQLITNHLARAACHNIPVVAVLCGIIDERLETPVNNEINPLSTVLFVLTQSLIDIRQSLSINQSHVQVSSPDTIHRICLLNTLRQLPLCLLTTLHKVLVKREDVNMILIHFKQFLLTINVQTSTCALEIFEMVTWKMMDEIMNFSYEHVMVKKIGSTKVRIIFEECLTIFEEIASRLCCLPQRMVNRLFDIKILTSLPRTALRESMIKESSMRLLRSLRPNNVDWPSSFRELSEFVIQNVEENLKTRIETIRLVFDKYLWFKMTDQVAQIGQRILETLENLINVDLSSIDEKNYLEKFAALREIGIDSIFTHFLSDASVDSNIAAYSYRILEEIFDENSIHRTSFESVFKQLCSLFENYLTYTRLTSFNHCSSIRKYFSKLSTNYRTFLDFVSPKLRLSMWKTLLHLRIRSSDGAIGLRLIETDQIVYGILCSDLEKKSADFGNLLDLNGYLSNLVDCLKLEKIEFVQEILIDLTDFLKEQSLVKISGLSTTHLAEFLIEKFGGKALKTKNDGDWIPCLVSCSFSQMEEGQISKSIDCLISNLESKSLTRIVNSIDGLILFLTNFPERISKSIEQIVSQMEKILSSNVEICKSILDFFQHFCSSEKFEEKILCRIVELLVRIVDDCENQGANNSISAQTILCFLYDRISTEKQKVFSYFFLRLVEKTGSIGDLETTNGEKSTRFPRSGSLSSLNEDLHNVEPSKRKLTILEFQPTNSNSSEEQINPLTKLREDLIRITIDFLNDRSFRSDLPKTLFVCLPRDLRRHHKNLCCLADQQVLFYINSFDFYASNNVNEFLLSFNKENDDSWKNRYRRYTDGSRKSISKRTDRTFSNKAQDDLHVHSLESDTKRSIFNERNLWIPVTVRTSASTKTFLAINPIASAGINEVENVQLHWFEAIQLSDTDRRKENFRFEQTDFDPEDQQELWMDQTILLDNFRSVVKNFDEREEKILRNRHVKSFFPQKIHRVPSEARKTIDSFDNVDPVRVAKIGLVYIRSGQEITESNILSNICCSKRFENFMSSLAKLRPIRELQQENFYCPLLDANNAENCGQFAYVWQNSIFQVLFHASNMMPNTRADHEFKKKLIGNDSVIIVYNENDQMFDTKILKTGVCQYTIEVCPIIDSNYSRVRLKRKLSTGATSPNSTNNSNIINAPIIVDQLVLEDRVACYVRVLALSLNQMCELEIRQRSSSGASFLISPWQNRLNTFKSLHKRCVLSYNQ